MGKRKNELTPIFPIFLLKLIKPVLLRDYLAQECQRLVTLIIHQAGRQLADPLAQMPNAEVSLLRWARYSAGCSIRTAIPLTK
jgi:hypothetical protein